MQAIDPFTYYHQPRTQATLLKAKLAGGLSIQTRCLKWVSRKGFSHVLNLLKLHSYMFLLELWFWGWTEFVWKRSTPFHPLVNTLKITINWQVGHHFQTHLKIRGLVYRCVYIYIYTCSPIISPNISHIVAYFFHTPLYHINLTTNIHYHETTK